MPLYVGKVVASDVNIRKSHAVLRWDVVVLHVHFSQVEEKSREKNGGEPGEATSEVAYAASFKR